MRISTIRGYDIYDVASAMQKAIRRQDVKHAGYFALELFHSNFYLFVWKRLLTISAEDCSGIITNEIYALFQAFLLIREKEKGLSNKGRMFISKAVLILCAAGKCRDADHLSNYIYDKKITIDDRDIEGLLNDYDDNEKKELPEYTFDCHTRIGKYKGKTKEDFFREELQSLKPKQKGLFDEIIN